MEEDEGVRQRSHAWADFHRNFAGRESLESIVSQSNMESVVSQSNTAIGDDGEGNDDDAIDDSSGPARGAASTLTLGVSYSGLTEVERRDIAAWHLRISCDAVFGRYYFPERQELRELKAIQEFLELEPPPDGSPGSSVSVENGSPASDNYPSLLPNPSACYWILMLED